MIEPLAYVSKLSTVPVISTVVDSDAADSTSPTQLIPIVYLPTFSAPRVPVMAFGTGGVSIVSGLN